MLSLQQSVDKLIYWSNAMQLKTNVDKCHVLSIRNHKRSKGNRPTQCQYLLDGILLSNVSITSDLGIIIDSNLSFKLHISTIISKALQRVGVFFEGFLVGRSILFIKLLSLIFVHCWNTTLMFGIQRINI